jgi:hypothetical protein
MIYEASTEVVFLRSLLEELGFQQKVPTILYEDNKSTIEMANGNGSFHRQKHILVKCHYTRELVKNRTIDIVHCQTQNMTADVLTKPLSKDSHSRLSCKLLGSKVLYGLMSRDE